MKLPLITSGFLMLFAVVRKAVHRNGHPEHIELTEEQLKEFVRTSPWTFARTMASTPHEYTLRKKAADEGLWEQVVLYIRQEGYKGKYGKTTYLYLDLQDDSGAMWQYWTMGCPLGPTGTYDPTRHTILINRTKLKDDTGHYRCRLHGPHTEFYCPPCKADATEQRSLW